MWWGKVRSSRRLQPLPHHEDVLAIGADTAASEENVETHLYLTDYRSLYVAGLLDITEADPRSDDAKHVPRYYADRGLNCDFWFRVFDIRLVVRDDLEAVASELARLRNVRYHDSPVSMYGGMLELPLIVSRSDDQQFFNDAENEQLADGMLWAKFDATQHGAGSLEVTLREDHFGAAAWSNLAASSRRFIATAEESYRSKRRDPTADLSDVIVTYAKAIEVQANATLRSALRNAPESARRVKIGDRTEILSAATSLTLGQLARAIGGERDLARHLVAALHDGSWFSVEFAAIIDEFSRIRNDAAHEKALSRDVVTTWRNRLLGVGGEGVMTRLARVHVR